MEKSVTQDGIATVVVQVVDFKPLGSRYMFTANNGNMQIKAMSPSTEISDIVSGKIQNLGLIRLLDYVINDMPGKSEEKYLFVKKWEVVPSTLDSENKSASKASAGRILKPTQDYLAKSASQIINDQQRYAATPARMNMSRRRVYPLVSLNLYEGSWTIKVHVTNKGNMSTYKNAGGEGCLFRVELTDEEGTQIQATMFNPAANKFYDRFQMGKVYYISRGSLKLANTQFKVVKNDYEMILNENSEVEEASEEEIFTSETKSNFVPIDELGRYVTKREIIDVIGVVQSVSPTMSIRKKADQVMIPKRDITLVDETRKTVVVSLWNDHATVIGQELLDMADSHPVIAIKSLKVGDYKGLSFSTINGSNVVINPDSPEANKLKSWYNSEGKETTMSAIGSGMSSSASGTKSMSSDRISISDITSNPSLGKDKPVFFNTRAYVSFIKPDQAMWYNACKTCNKKVTEAMDSGYWCKGCQKKDEECSLRYAMTMKVSDSTGEAWFSTFNDEAEKIIGCTTDELKKLKSEEGEVNREFQTKLKEAAWSSYLFGISVLQQEYNSVKRQRVIVRRMSTIDYGAEARLLLQDISKNKTSR